MEQTTKPAWQSKTIIVNAVLGLCAALLPFVPAAAGIQAFVQGHMGEIGMGWSVLNIILRAVSKDAITLTD